MRGQEMDTVITFRANAQLIAETEALAASEGISRSDVARRALLRDLDRSRHLIGEPADGLAGRMKARDFEGKEGCQ
jgi:hypothetical protein